jgi:hypothetical protein
VSRPPASGIAFSGRAARHGGVRGPAAVARRHHRRRGQPGAASVSGDGKAAAGARVRARADEAAVEARVWGAAVRVAGVDEGARGDAARKDDADAVQRADWTPQPAVPRQDIRREGRVEGRRSPLRGYEQRRPAAQGELRQVHR